jgi:hypothetical protein
MLFGLCKVNLNLNRQIYSTIAGDINNKSSLGNDNKNSWNLDHMEDILTYPEKYNIGGGSGDVESKANVPKIRILYNHVPFDFRIDTNNYIFFINNQVLENLSNKANNLINSFRNKTVKVWNLIES